jgi:hypothetical protein
MVAEATPIDRVALEEKLEELYRRQRDLDLPGVIAQLREIVPEFQPEKAGLADRRLGKLGIDG